ncbi:MAG: serine/threonine-protein kinase [Verrucomicrobiota bacterium]
MFAKLKTSIRDLDQALPGSAIEKMGIALLNANRAILAAMGLIIVPLGIFVFDVEEFKHTWPIAILFFLVSTTLAVLSWRSPKWAHRGRLAAPIIDLPLWGAMQFSNLAYAEQTAVPAMLYLSMASVLVLLSSLCMKVGLLTLTTCVGLVGAMAMFLVEVAIPPPLMIGGPLTILAFPILSKVLQKRFFLDSIQLAPTEISPANAARVFQLATPVSKTLRGGSAIWEPPPLAHLAHLLEGYEIQQLLGRGGMGAVYRGLQSSLNRSVAIKILPAELTDEDESFIDRFRREGEAMAALSHPNIVTIHDFGETDADHCYLIMEFVDGLDLHQLIQRGELNQQRSLEIVSKVCDALEYAHRQGYVHRDLKPANILISKDGEVKLCDFGLAKVVAPEEANAAPQPTLTQIGSIMGTPDYSSPEQLDGREVDHRADLYSLGVIVYEMLTGEIPRGVFVPPSEKTGVDERLDQLVRKAMMSEISQRYQSATEIRTEVASIQS